ncbi:MAG: flagellar export chaperone FlgN [candidate division Zixibacteria bacterium]|nr:flagellar export chaperone FlgN [candidate division Zixibacteria bacterium]
MDFRPTASLEKEIISLLKDELSFYQSMFILADKQKDCIKLGRETELAQVYADITRFSRRIAESEARLSNIMEKDRKSFVLASSHLEVRRLVDSLSAIVEKNISLLNENRSAASSREAFIQSELQELTKSRQLLKLFAGRTGGPGGPGEKNNLLKPGL